MKNLTVFPLSSYKFKIAGIIITGLALLLIILDDLYNSINFLKGLTDHQFSDLLYWLFVLGLFIIATSKEKIDDERVEKIRARSFRAAFTVMVAWLMSISFIDIIYHHGNRLNFNSIEIIIIVGFLLIFYLITFYVAYFFDPAAVYNDDTPKDNFKKNKVFFIIYSSILLGALIILLLLK